MGFEASFFQEQFFLLLVCKRLLYQGRRPSQFSLTNLLDVNLEQKGLEGSFREHTGKKYEQHQGPGCQIQYEKIKGEDLNTYICNPEGAESCP